MNELLSIFRERPQLQSILIPIMELKQGKMVAVGCYDNKVGNGFKPKRILRTPLLVYRETDIVDWTEGQPEQGRGFMMKKPEYVK